MEIDNVLTGLSERLGLPRLRLDEDRAWARLTELPRVVSTLLEANDRPDAMLGAHFTVGPDSEELVLCRTLDMDRA